MNKIPTHKISDQHPGKSAFLKHISSDEGALPVDYPHRDDYYVFVFIEKGKAVVSVDFEKHEVEGPIAHFSQPGQVHFVVSSLNICGWILIVDSMLVKDEYKDVFERASLCGNPPRLDERRVTDLKNCLSLIQHRLKPGMSLVEQSITHSLLSSYIGILAEILQKQLPASANKRLSTITSQFRSLLSKQYKTLKSPSQYAARMNISPAYLNEAIKKTTGLSASKCIRSEIITQAKRLLFYTDLSIKEIALELGYEDWAYFTRLFTQASSITPTQFRSQYRK